MLHQDVWALSGQAMGELLRDVLARDGSCRFRARGSSMSPLIRDGDLVTVSCLDADGHSLGRVIVTLPPDGRLAVHRVVGVGRGGVVTKGDGLGSPDATVDPAAVIGTVTRVQRRGSDVAFGSGPERRLVAVLSQTGMLAVAVRVARSARRLLQIAAIERLKG